MDFLKTRYIPMSRRRRIYEGKAKVLYEGPEPGTLIQHFKEKNSLMEGSLASMRPSQIQLIKPRSAAGNQFRVPGKSEPTSHVFPPASGITLESLTRSPFDFPFNTSYGASGHGYLTQDYPEDK